MTESSLTKLTEAQIALKDFKFSSTSDTEIKNLKEMYSGSEITGEGKERTGC